MSYRRGGMVSLFLIISGAGFVSAAHSSRLSLAILLALPDAVSIPQKQPKQNPNASSLRFRQAGSCAIVWPNFIHRWSQQILLQTTEILLSPYIFTLTNGAVKRLFLV